MYCVGLCGCGCLITSLMINCLECSPGPSGGMSCCLLGTVQSVMGWTGNRNMKPRRRCQLAHEQAPTPFEEHLTGPLLSSCMQVHFVCNIFLYIATLRTSHHNGSQFSSCGGGSRHMYLMKNSSWFGRLFEIVHTCSTCIHTTCSCTYTLIKCRLNLNFVYTWH